MPVVGCEAKEVVNMKTYGLERGRGFNECLQLYSSLSQVTLPYPTLLDPRYCFYADIALKSKGHLDFRSSISCQCPSKLNHYHVSILPSHGQFLDMKERLGEGIGKIQLCL